MYLTGPTSQICSEFFFLGERGAQSGLIGEFLVKMVIFSLFHHYLNIFGPISRFKA
jgi:hypothetical protein